MIVENEKPWLFLKAAFLAGFMSSAEGWNGEYPFNGNKASAWEGGVSERFDLWRETGEALSERLVKKAASVSGCPKTSGQSRFCGSYAPAMAARSASVKVCGLPRLSVNVPVRAISIQLMKICPLS